MRFRHEAVVLALCLAVAGAAHAQDDRAQQVQGLTSTIVDLSVKFARAQRCSWMKPSTAEALRLVRDEAMAQLSLVAPDQLLVTQMRVDQQVKAEAAKACNDAERPQTVQAAGDAGVMLLVRAQALLDAEKQAPWAANLTTLGPYAPQISSLMDKLRAGAGEAALKPVMDRQASAARATLRVVCGERKTVRWKGERPCPTLTAQETQAATFARVLVSGSERFAPLYFASVETTQAATAKADADKRARLAALGDLSRYYKPFKWDTLAGLDKAYLLERADCTLGDYVLDPKAPGFGIVTGGSAGMLQGDKLIFVVGPGRLTRLGEAVDKPAPSKAWLATRPARETTVITLESLDDGTNELVVAIGEKAKRPFAPEALTVDPNGMVALYKPVNTYRQCKAKPAETTAP